jgi:hypothetical protein
MWKRKAFSAWLHDQLRVIDESGEDYPISCTLFAPIALPTKVRRAVLAAV